MSTPETPLVEPSVAEPAGFDALVEDYLERQAERRYSQALVSNVPLNANTNGVDVALRVAAGACRVLGFGVDNTGVACYVQVFDAVELPVDTAVPVRSWALPGGASLDVAFETHGRWFQRGCWIVGSSTQSTKTLLATAALLIDAQRM